MTTTAGDHDSEGRRPWPVARAAGRRLTWTCDCHYLQYGGKEHARAKGGRPTALVPMATGRNNISETPTPRSTPERELGGKLLVGASGGAEESLDLWI
jgi:hypothetical protein